MPPLYNPDAVINSRKPLKADEKGQQWNFFDRWKLNEGEYSIKFLSHSDKCPDGYKLYTVHSIEQEPEEKTKDNLKAFCTESTHGMREGRARVYDDDGKPVLTEDGKPKIIAASALREPCYICDLLEDMRRIDDGQWYEELDENFREILHKMSSSSSRAILLPAIIYVKEVPGEKGTRYAPGPTPMGVVFSLKINKDSADLALYRLVCNLSKAVGEATFFAPEGPWCTYSKAKTTQNLDVDQERKFLKEEDKLYKSYPNIIEWGKGVESGSYKKPSKKVGYEKMRAMVKKTWWAKSMAKEPPRGVGYDFDDESFEGFSCQIQNEVTAKKAADLEDD